MKRSLFLSGLYPMVIAAFCLMVFSSGASAQTKGTFNDARDGHVYTWMAENLSYDSKTGSWSYNNDTANLLTYGRLYNWKTAQTACPKGWRVPAEKDWNDLIKTLGGGEQAGLKMQAMDTIKKVKTPPAPGTAALTTLLGGVRHPDGSCIGLNYWGGYWTSTKVNDTIAKNVLFAHGRGDLDLSTNDRNTGFYLRCVKK
jgi:uncharacterized protein (TIGR02145 family)